VREEDMEALEKVIGRVNGLVELQKEGMVGQ